MDFDFEFVVCCCMKMFYYGFFGGCYVFSIRSFKFKVKMGKDDVDWEGGNLGKGSLGYDSVGLDEIGIVWFDFMKSWYYVWVKKIVCVLLLK